MNNWSRAKIGKNRVYWLTRSGWCWDEDCKVIGDGVASSFAEAEVAAKAVAGKEAEQDHAYCAGRHYQKKVREVRAAVGAKRRETVVKEYLYSHSWSDYDGALSVLANLVVKKTPRRVFVIQQCLDVEYLGTAREVWSNPYHDSDIVLDRIALEREGHQWSRRFHGRLYLRREEAGNLRSRPEFSALGIGGEFTEEEVRAAYRRKAKEVHPDRGGDAASFVAVEDEYRRAMARFL